MSKTVYVMKVGLEVEVDPKNPKTLTAAAEWLGKVSAGTVITPPDGLKLVVAVISEPDIVKRRSE
jgi:hypothetical protein